MRLSPPRFWLRSLLLGSASVSPSPFSLLGNKRWSSYRAIPHPPCRLPASVPVDPTLHRLPLPYSPSALSRLVTCSRGKHPSHFHFHIVHPAPKHS